MEGPKSNHAASSLNGQKSEIRSSNFVKSEVRSRKLGSKVGACAVVRASVSHQCGPGSNPGVGVICGLSLLLVLSLAPRGFSPGAPVFPSHQKPALTDTFKRVHVNS